MGLDAHAQRMRLVNHGIAGLSVVGLLAHADHVEQDAKRAVAVYSVELTEQIQSVRRLAADAVHFFMAWVGEKSPSATSRPGRAWTAWGWSRISSRCPGFEDRGSLAR